MHLLKILFAKNGSPSRCGLDPLARPQGGTKRSLVRGSFKKEEASRGRDKSRSLRGFVCSPHASLRSVLLPSWAVAAPAFQLDLVRPELALDLRPRGLWL